MSIGIFANSCREVESDEEKSGQEYEEGGLYLFRVSRAVCTSWTQDWLRPRESDGCMDCDHPN